MSNTDDTVEDDSGCVFFDAGMCKTILAKELEIADRASVRYFIGYDNDAHSYVVPCDKETEWLEWVERYSEERRVAEIEHRATDRSLLEAPAYAKPLCDYLTFALPETVKPK